MEIPVNGTKTEIYAKLKAGLDKLTSKGKLPLDEVKFSDDKCEAQAKGPGFKAFIQCLDGKIALKLDLNFMLKAMKGTIEEQIQKNFKKIFGE